MAGKERYEVVIIAYCHRAGAVRQSCIAPAIGAVPPDCDRATWPSAINEAKLNAIKALVLGRRPGGRCR
jgi:hypothetical protein